MTPSFFRDFQISASRERRVGAAACTLSPVPPTSRTKIVVLLTALTVLTLGMMHISTARADDVLHTGTYTLDPAHTEIIFAVSHLGLSIFHGTFDKSEGSLSFDADNPAASRLSVKVKADSVDTNTAALNDQLKAAEMFDVANHPEITFEATKIAVTGDKTGTVTGNLTIKSTTRPVTLDVRLDGAGTQPMLGTPAMGFSAKTTIKRSEFGLDQWLPVVGDEVALYLYSEFNRTD